MGLFLMSQGEESDPSKVNVSISLRVLLRGKCMHACHSRKNATRAQVLVNSPKVVIFISNCF